MITRRHLLLGGLTAAALVVGGIRQPATAEPAVAVGKPVPEITVTDARGLTRTLSEFRGKTVVLEWTAKACPFVKAHYAGTMQALQKWATDRGVVWLSVISTHPSRSDYLPPKEAADLIAERGAAPTALLMDPSGRLGRAFGARTTPHMFIIGSDGVLAYAGAIDDRSTYDPSVIPRSRNYVRAALEEIQAGKPVSTASTSAYGCRVGYGS